MTQDDMLKDLNSQIIKDLYKKAAELFPEVAPIKIDRDFKTGTIDFDGLTSTQFERLIESV
jgi:hypothetical protein